MSTSSAKSCEFYENVIEDMQQRLQEKEASLKYLMDDFGNSISKFKGDIKEFQQHLQFDGCSLEVSDSDHIQISELQAELRNQKHRYDASLGLEKAKSLLQAQLMSTQLVNSVNDVVDFDADLHETKGKRKDGRSSLRGRIRRMFKPQTSQSSCKTTSRSRNSLHTPPSSPSGYETSSLRSSFNEAGSLEETLNKTEDTGNVNVDHIVSLTLSTLACSPLIKRFKSNESPKRYQISKDLENNLSDLQARSAHPIPELYDNIHQLYQEMKRIQLLLDDEIEDFFSFQLLQNDQMTADKNVIKRNVYRDVVQLMLDPCASSHFTLELLHEASNLVLLDQTLTTCLLALKSYSQDSKTSNTNSDESKKLKNHRRGETEQQCTVTNMIPTHDELQESKASQKTPSFIRQFRCTPGKSPFRRRKK